jgi:hypothetical protein
MKLPPEARSVPEDGTLFSLRPSDAYILAGESARQQIELARRDGYVSDVLVSRDFWPVATENLVAKRMDLYEGLGHEELGRRQTKSEPADPAE